MGVTPWEVWAGGVLDGVKAPRTTDTVEALWAWSGAESLPRDRMSWCNPLNTTQGWAGAQDMNSVGVKRYVSVADGVGATVMTLLNGHYPVILANLRNSTDRHDWSNACPNLGTWGTGCGWLSQNYGALPGNLGGTMADLDRMQNILEMLAGRFMGIKGSIPTVQNELDAILAASGGGVPADLTQLKADVAAIKATVTKIETALKGA